MIGTCGITYDLECAHISGSASRADSSRGELCRRSRNRGIAALQNVLDTESIMICFKQAHETLAWRQRQSQLRTCSETIRRQNRNRHRNNSGAMRLDRIITRASREAPHPQVLCPTSGRPFNPVARPRLSRDLLTPLPPARDDRENASVTPYSRSSCLVFAAIFFALGRCAVHRLG